TGDADGRVAYRRRLSQLRHRGTARHDAPGARRRAVRAHRKHQVYPMTRAWRRVWDTTFNDQRGTAWVLTIILMLSLLAVGGLAIDTMHAVAVRNELQKAMDAAGLAGPGNLGFSAWLFRPHGRPPRRTPA